MYPFAVLYSNKVSRPEHINQYTGGSLNPERIPGADGRNVCRFLKILFYFFLIIVYNRL